jgi:hypothetical protein
MDLARRVDLIRADRADAADRALTAPITSCPERVMAGHVRHILQVHRSWGRTITAIDVD